MIKMKRGSKKKAKGIIKKKMHGSVRNLIKRRKANKK